MIDATRHGEDHRLRLDARGGHRRDATAPHRAGRILGTAQYTAPEYFLGEAGTPRSDLFSLGVIAYQMLSGRLPYGAEVAKARTRAAQRSCAYALGAGRATARSRPGSTTLCEGGRIPIRVKRYEELSEFVYDLRHPSRGVSQPDAPARCSSAIRSAFWKGVCSILAVVIALLLLRK